MTLPSDLLELVIRHLDVETPSSFRDRCRAVLAAPSLMELWRRPDSPLWSSVLVRPAALIQTASASLLQAVRDHASAVKTAHFADANKPRPRANEYVIQQVPAFLAALACRPPQLQTLIVDYFVGKWSLHAPAFATIGLLTSLQTLRLQGLAHDHDSSHILAAVGQLQNLKDLDLRWMNEKGELIPLDQLLYEVSEDRLFLYKLTRSCSSKLEALTICGFRHHEVALQLAPMPRLTSLVLSNSWIIDAWRPYKTRHAGLAELTALETLMLAPNGATAPHSDSDDPHDRLGYSLSLPTALGTLTRLRHLHLGGPGVDINPPHATRGVAASGSGIVPSGLTSLVLDDDDERVLSPFLLGAASMSQLRELALSRGCINMRPFSAFMDVLASLPALRALQLTGCVQGDIAADGHYRQLTRLTALDLGGNMLRSLPPTFCASLSACEVLGLAGNAEIYLKPPPFLLGMVSLLPRLRLLNVCSTSEDRHIWTAEQRAQFAAGLATWRKLKAGAQGQAEVCCREQSVFVMYDRKLQRGRDFGTFGAVDTATLWDHASDRYIQ